MSQDYRRRLEWDPFLSTADLSAAEPAVGVQARCVSKLGIGMTVEYVSFRPSEVAAVKMIRGPLVLESFAASWNFRSLGSDRTKVIFQYSFRVRPYCRVVEPLLRLYFEREMARRLRALKVSSEGDVGD